MIKDQMFSQMNQAALARLAGRDPREIACKAGVLYEEKTHLFRLTTMGMDVTISYPDSIPAQFPGGAENLAAG